MRELRDTCDGLAIEIVLIGAMALRVWLPQLHRLTEDIDVAVALDLEEFASLSARLIDLGWRPEAYWEPRWHSRARARVDLLPLGPRAREQRQIVWPRAETVMHVVGYDSVFKEAIARELAAGLAMRVVPLHVLAFLKLAAYLDAPTQRQKDLGDLLLILNTYAEDGERRFVDEVLDAGIDYDEAGAFLLGRDLRSVCVTSEEAEVVHRFLGRVTDRDFQIPIQLRPWLTADDDEAASVSRRQCKALARGFLSTSLRE